MCGNIRTIVPDIDAPTTDKQVLAQRKADRYFVERIFQDIKSSLGFADLQAQKYVHTCTMLPYVQWLPYLLPKLK